MRSTLYGVGIDRLGSVLRGGDGSIGFGVARVLRARATRDENRPDSGSAVRVGRKMTAILQDVIYGLRMMRKSPGVTALAVFTLALGIGANTAIFSNVNALLPRPFAFPDLDRVAVVWETVPKQDANNVKAAPANFRDWTEQNKTFSYLAAIHGWDANVTGNGVAERVEGYQVSADFFTLLGVAPQLGRQIGRVDFEHGVAPVVVLSHGFWQRHLGG